MKCQTRKYFIQALKYYFSIGVSQTVGLLGLLRLKFEKRFRKGCYNKKTLTFVYFFPNQIKNFCPFRTDVPIRSHAFRTLRAGTARNRTNHETSEKIDIK